MDTDLPLGTERQQRPSTPPPPPSQPPEHVGRPNFTSGGKTLTRRPPVSVYLVGLIKDVEIL